MTLIFIDSLTSTLQQLGSVQGEVTLMTRPELIGACGVGYFTTIAHRARQHYPQLSIKLAVWCHADPALVFAALEQNVEQIYFDSNSALWPKIQSLCAQNRVTLTPLSEVADAVAYS